MRAARLMVRSSVDEDEEEKATKVPLCHALGLCLRECYAVAVHVGICMFGSHV